MTIDQDTQHPDRSPISVQPASLRPEGFTIAQPDDAILTSQSFRNTPFADLPLYLPTLSNPVVGFDGGFNRAALEVSDKGVTCILLPYLEQVDRDFIELKLNGVRVDFHTVTEDEARQGLQIVLHVASERFIREAGNTLQAFVTHVGGGSDQTKPFNIKVDIEFPGGRNPVASTPQNENLPKPVFPQDVIDFGVTSENSINPIPVSIGYYPVNTNLPRVNHRKVRDEIRLSLGGVVVKHPVTEFEAAGEAPIIINVNTGTWDKVGDGVHVCEYEVVDEVGNHSQGFSPPQVIEVRRNTGAEPLLPAPYIAESIERPGQNDLLDADDLDGNDATIVVEVNRQGYELGDVLRLKVSGRTEGSQLITTFYDHPIDSTTRAQRIRWPYADILPLIDGRVQLTYQRLRLNALPRNSLDRSVDITGTPVEAGLAPPIVLEAVGGNLPAATDPVTVFIRALTGYPANARVLLVLNGTYANGRSYYAEHTARAGQNDIVLELPNGPNGEIAQLEGGSLSLHYTVNGGPPSRRLNLYVGGLRAILPAPITREAVPPDHVFDPDKNRGNLNVTVKAHPAFTLGATVYLYAEGSAPGGSAPRMEFEIDENWLGVDLPFVVARLYVTANLNGTQSLYYTVVKPGQRDMLSEALTIRVGAALDLPVPEVLESTQITPTLSRLNPAHVLQSGVVTVRVRYRPMLASDDIEVYVIGKPELGTPVIGIKPGIPAPGGDYVDFTVPNVFVGANLAQSCRVFYEVIRDHKREPSRELTLEIEALEAQYWDLVSVPQAETNGGVIDVTKAHDVRIDAWPFLRYDPENPQSVWIDAEGTVNQVLRNGTPLTPAEFAAERILTPIPASYLRRLADGSPLDLKAYVSLDGGGRATAQRLVPASYRIRKQPGVVDSINVGGGPDRIVINAEGTVAYVANYNSATVSVIDLTTFSLSDTIIMPANTYTNGLALHPDGSRLYVSGYYSSEIQVIDTSDNTISNKITGIHVYGFGGLAFNLDGSRLYYGAYYQAQLQVIDTSNDTLIYTGYAYYPVDLALAPQGTRLYCAGLSAMGIIDTATNTQLSTLSGFSYAWRLAYSPYAQKIYVTDQSAANVKIVDARTNLISNTIPNLTGAFGIAFHPTRRLAYVTMHTSNSVAIIDIDKEEVIRTLTGFVYPKSIAIAPDGSYALVSNYNANTVFIVQL
ncbi:YncE family protein [Pseudomonas sp. Root569]|uniref:YncE family protein n=1 Tax=Pseudomonas sp. Root569 TaxID=1736566 RepID=UPI0007031569|nr:YncE family protein [Pseudomonas sp. Root569]KRA08329.1 hypothetical protein ASD70_10585 [Pseudomonas sp. Root569]